MAEQDDEVRRAVQAVAEADDDELYRELGLRLKAVERDPEIGKSFSPPRELLEPKGIALGDLVQVGKNYFASVSKMAYSVVCSGMQGAKFDSLIASVGKDRFAAMAALTAILSTPALGIVAALAPMIAALVIGKVLPPTVEALCAGWAKKAGIAEGQPATQPA